MSRSNRRPTGRPRLNLPREVFGDGTESNRSLAGRLGVCVATVAKYRREHGLPDVQSVVPPAALAAVTLAPPAVGSHRRPVYAVVERLVRAGTPDKEIAQVLQRTRSRVAQIRVQLGLPPVPAPPRPRRVCPDPTLLGTLSDAALGRKWSVGAGCVASWRVQHSVARYCAPTLAETAPWVGDLGRIPDTRIARENTVSLITVLRARALLGIPAASHPVSPEIRARIGAAARARHAAHREATAAQTDPPFILLSTVIRAGPPDRVGETGTVVVRFHVGPDDTLLLIGHNYTPDRVEEGHPLPLGETSGQIPQPTHNPADPT